MEETVAKSSRIPWNIRKIYETKIYERPAKRILVNILLSEMKKLYEINTKRLDDWLRTVPD